MLCAQSYPTLCNTMGIAHEVPLSIEFSRQEYWNGLIFPSPYQYYNNSKCYNWFSQVVLVVKNMSASRRHKRSGFDPWVGKIPWRRAKQFTPVFLHGKSHGQRSLVGYSPCGHKESDMTETTWHTVL